MNHNRQAGAYHAGLALTSAAGLAATLTACGASAGAGTAAHTTATAQPTGLTSSQDAAQRAASGGAALDRAACAAFYRDGRAVDFANLTGPALRRWLKQVDGISASPALRRDFQTFAADLTVYIVATKHRPSQARIERDAAAIKAACS